MPNYESTHERDRDFCVRKFVTKLQTPHQKDSNGNLVIYDKKTLLKAMEISIDLEKCIFGWSKKENERQDKFKQIMSILIS